MQREKEEKAKGEEKGMWVRVIRIELLIILTVVVVTQDY
jgi:hypothetical protein